MRAPKRICSRASRCWSSCWREDTLPRRRRAAVCSVLKLLILPGLDGTGARLTPFIRELGPTEARVIPYPRDEPMGYAELESLVRAALPGAGRYVLLAESFSGPLAIRIAADPPEGLAGVILCGTFASNPFPWLGPLRALAAWLPLRSLPRWLRAPLMWSSLDPRRATPQKERAMAGVAAAVLRGRLREVLQVDETSRLAAVRLPMLILAANRDRIVPRSATRRLLQCMPGAELTLIEGPHLLLQCCPAACAAVVLKFLRRWN